jgi:hypothetical protein
MRRNVPYAVIIPIVVVCVAVALMFLAMRGTSGGGAGNGETTGIAYSRPNTDAVRVPTTPSNDTAADSARTPDTPLNKSR